MGVTAATVQNIVYLKVAREIAEEFRKNNCPVAFLKGMSLLETVYPDLEERFMGDIDILVPHLKLLEACRILRDMGYENPNPTLEFRKWQPGGIPIWIDLHPGLWFFEEERLWQRVQPKENHDREGMLVLAPEDNLLHIVLHALLQDGGFANTALKDAEALLHYHGSHWRWQAFWMRAEEEGWSRATTLFLDELSHQHPEVEIMWPLAGVSEKKLTRLRRRIINPQMPAYLRMVWAQDRWAKKIKILWQVIFPPANFLALRYPQIPVWMRPFARLGMLGWKICYTKIR